MAIITADMMKMSPAELDELYQNSPVGEIPNGQGRGTVIDRYVSYRFQSIHSGNRTNTHHSNASS